MKKIWIENCFLTYNGILSVTDNWKILCKADLIENNKLSEFAIDGHEYVVTRANDEFFVYPLNCPHMDEPLSNGSCDGKTLTCLFHLWKWDLRTGKSIGDTEIDLKVYRSKVENGNLLINIEKS